MDTKNCDCVFNGINPNMSCLLSEPCGKPIKPTKKIEEKMEVI